MAASSQHPPCVERAIALAQHVWSGRACTGQTRWWPAVRVQSVVQARPCAPSMGWLIARSRRGESSSAGGFRASTLASTMAAAADVYEY